MRGHIPKNLGKLYGEQIHAINVINCQLLTKTQSQILKLKLFTPKNGATFLFGNELVAALFDLSKRIKISKKRSYIEVQRKKRKIFLDIEDKRLYSPPMDT